MSLPLARLPHQGSPSPYSYSSTPKTPARNPTARNPTALRVRSEDNQFPLFRSLRAPDAAQPPARTPPSGEAASPPQPPGTAAGGPSRRGPPSTWDTWDQWAPLDNVEGEDWEPWEEPDRPVGGPRKYPRRMSTDGRPRDEFLRPIVDFAGIRDRLSTDAISTEERITEEFASNQEDSREALKFAGEFLELGTCMVFAPHC